MEFKMKLKKIYLLLLLSLINNSIATEKILNNDVQSKKEMKTDYKELESIGLKEMTSIEKEAVSNALKEGISKEDIQKALKIYKKDTSHYPNLKYKKFNIFSGGCVDFVNYL
jgi:hypothetical protein